MSDQVTYYVARRDGGVGYGVKAASDVVFPSSVLMHDALTLGEAEFLAAHMNHAFESGMAAGDKKCRDAICGPAIAQPPPLTLTGRKFREAAVQLALQIDIEVDRAERGLRTLRRLGLIALCLKG